VILRGIDVKQLILSTVMVWTMSSTMAFEAPLRGLPHLSQTYTLSATAVSESNSKALIHFGGKSYWVYEGTYIPSTKLTIVSVTSLGVVVDDAGTFKRLDITSAPTGALSEKPTHQQPITPTGLVNFARVMSGEWYARSGRARGIRIVAIDVQLFKRAGLIEGDVITSIDGEELDKRQPALESFKKLKEKDSSQLTIYRNKELVTISVDLRSVL